MLSRFPIKELKSGALNKRYAHLVVAMQFYPRFVKKDLISEYCHSLAPERSLFQEFKKKEEELGDHDRAFAEVDYEARFDLTVEGAENLKRLSELARTQEVYLFCQCEATQRCHTDLLLLLAKHWFHTPTPWMRLSYPRFSERIESGDLREEPAARSVP